MPLQNRVTPKGDIIAVEQRGMFMGNRGGKIHHPFLKELHPTKRWASKQWITCVTEFKNRQRTVMGESYTELFFLDEVTALAAGHRPCFECRRKDANAFAAAWARSFGPARAPEMDKMLHEERLEKKAKRLHPGSWEALPMGVIVEKDDQFIAKSSSGPVIWSFDGYRPVADPTALTKADAIICLTPPSILEVLKNGYQPHWHPTANPG